MSDPGALLGTHRVANRRILGVGLFGLIIGISGAVVTANLVLGGPSQRAGNSSSIDRTIGVSTGLAVAGVLGASTRTACPTRTVPRGCWVPVTAA